MADIYIRENKYLELDYLEEKLGSTGDISITDGSNNSIDPTNNGAYIGRKKQVFDPKEVGDYTIEYNGETITVSVFPTSGVSRYRFESGSVTEDSWGSNTLTDNTSAGTTTDAIRGDAKVFDGTDDYMDPSFSFPSTDTFTLSAWVKTPKDDNNNVVVDSYDGSRPRIQLSVGDNGQNNSVVFRAEESLSTGITIDSVDTLVETDEWMHIAGIRNGGDGLVYVNGVLVETDSNSNFASDLSKPIEIGRRPDNASHFNGEIDDVRIYDRALSDREVTSLYNNGYI